VWRGVFTNYSICVSIVIDTEHTSSMADSRYRCSMNPAIHKITNLLILMNNRLIAKVSVPAKVIDHFSDFGAATHITNNI